MFDDRVTADANDAVRLSAIMGFYAGFISFAVLLSLFKGDWDSVWFNLIPLIPLILIGIWGVSKLMARLKLKNFGQLYAFYRNTKGTNSKTTLEKQHELEKEALRKKILELEKELQLWESKKNRWQDSFGPVCSVLGDIIDRAYDNPTYKIRWPDFKEEVIVAHRDTDNLGKAISEAWKHVPIRLKYMDGKPSKGEVVL